MTGPRHGAMRRRGLPIFWKLVAGLLLPGAVAFAAFGWWAAFQVTQATERELGLRLRAVAGSAAVLVLPEELAFLEPGDETSRTYRSIRRRLERLRASTGVRRIYLFDDELRSLCDTEANVPIGRKYYHLEVHRKLLEQARVQGSAATVLYKGPGGLRYKTGFATVRDAKGRVVAFVAAEASAAYYRVLASVARRTAVGGALVLAALVLLSALVAGRLSRPLRRLSEAAERIGRGELSEPIRVQASGEVGLVAQSMERMRKELERRDQEMKMMLAGVAHEVRNPLAGMRLAAGLLAEEASEDPERAEQVQEILEDLEYLERVVQDFLEYARWDRPELNEADLVQLADRAVATVQAEAGEKDVTIQVSAEPEEIPVSCDEVPVVRTLVNLIKNAVQASPEGGTVEVTVRLEEAVAQVAVSDQGPGISEDVSERIFEPFFTTKEKGSGLGLALGRKVAEAHGGRLFLDETWKSGARFVLELPAGPRG